MSHLTDPQQLSFDFLLKELDSRSGKGAEDEQRVFAKSASVFDFASAAVKRDQKKSEHLYERILDSIKHLSYR